MMTKLLKTILTLALCISSAFVSIGTPIQVHGNEEVETPISTEKPSLPNSEDIPNVEEGSEIEKTEGEEDKNPEEGDPLFSEYSKNSELFSTSGADTPTTYATTPAKYVIDDGGTLTLPAGSYSCQAGSMNIIDVRGNGILIVEGDIEFKRINCAYGGALIHVPAGTNLTIKPSESVASAGTQITLTMDFPANEPGRNGAAGNPPASYRNRGERASGGRGGTGAGAAIGGNGSVANPSGPNNTVQEDAGNIYLLGNVTVAGVNFDNADGQSSWGGSGSSTTKEDYHAGTARDYASTGSGGGGAGGWGYPGALIGRGGPAGGTGGYGGAGATGDSSAAATPNVGGAGGGGAGGGWKGKASPGSGSKTNEPKDSSEWGGRSGGTTTGPGDITGGLGGDGVKDEDGRGEDGEDGFSVNNTGLQTNGPPVPNLTQSNLYTSFNANKANYTGQFSSYYGAESIPVNANKFFYLNGETDVFVAGAPFTYNGSSIQPTISVRVRNTSSNIDPNNYTVSYTDNINAGTATVKVAGKNDYTVNGGAIGEVSTTFTIEKATEKRTMTSTIDSTGKSMEFGGEFKTFVSNNPLNNDATISYEITSGAATITQDVANKSATIKPTKVGNITVKTTIGATANWKEQVITTTYSITPRSIARTTVDNVDSQLYTGNRILPKPAVSDPNIGYTMVEGIDYQYVYSLPNIDAASTANVTVKGIGNYKDTEDRYFTIRPIDTGTAAITINPLSNLVYTGNSQMPTPVVTFDRKVLDNSNYSVSYSANTTDVGTVTVTVIGKKSFSGTLTATYKIVQADITNNNLLTVVNNPNNVVFDGKAMESKPTLKYNNIPITEGTAGADDYKLTYANNVTPGTATVTITGINNFKGTKSLTYQIGKRNLYLLPDANQSKLYGTQDPSVYTYKTYINKLSADNTTETGTKLSDAFVPNYKPTFNGGIKRTSGEALGNYDYEKNTLAFVPSNTFNSYYTLNFLGTTNTFKINEFVANEVATLEGIHGNDGWFKNEQVHIQAPTGYQVGTNNAVTGVTWTDYLVFEDGDFTSAGKSYFLKRTSDGAIANVKTIEFKQDKVAPIGTMVLGDYVYTNLQSYLDADITYSNADMHAKISSKDKLSGNTDPMSYVSEVLMDRADLDALPLDSWKDDQEILLDIASMDNKKVNLYMRVEDKAGNVDYVGTRGIMFDSKNPELVANYDYDGVWTKEANPKIIGTIFDGESGLKDRYVTYKIGNDPLKLIELDDNGNYIVENLVDGDYPVVIEAYDKANNEAVKATLQIKKDTIVPKLRISADTLGIEAKQNVSFTPTYGSSGEMKLEVKFDKGEWETVPTGTSVPYVATENGKYTFRVTNNVGVLSNEASITFTKIDNKEPKPVLEFKHEGTVIGSNEYTNGDVNTTFYSEEINLGRSTFEYSLDGTNYTTVQANVNDVAEVPTITTEGMHTVYARITSEAGVEGNKSDVINIDLTKPEGVVSAKEIQSASLLNAITFGIFFDKSYEVSIKATDPTVNSATSGVKSVNHYVDTRGASGPVYTTPDEIEAFVDEQWAEGTSVVVSAEQSVSVVYFKIEDNAGNIAYVTSNTVTKDNIEPTITTDFNFDEWHSQAQVNFVVSDNLSGVKEVQYQLNETTAVDVQGTNFTVDGLADGIHTLSVVVIDHSGNKTNESYTIKQDAGVPTITATINASLSNDEKVVIDIDGEYSGASGIKGIYLRKNNQNWVDITNKLGNYEGTYETQENGIHDFKIVTGAGVEAVQNVTINQFVAKTVKPIVTAYKTDGTPYILGDWSNQDVTLKFSNEIANLNGISYQLKKGFEAWKPVTAVNGYVDILIAEEGLSTYHFKLAADLDGVFSEAIGADVKVDKTKPNVEMTIEEASARAFSLDVFTKSQLVTIKGDDDISGIKEVNYYVHKIAENLKDTESFTSPADVEAFVNGRWVAGDSVRIDGEASYMIFGKVTDKAGNTEYVVSNGVIVDSVAPDVKVDEETWITNTTTDYKVTVLDKFADFAGAKGSVKYKVGNGAYSQAALNNKNEFFIPNAKLAEGVNKLTIVATDYTGNEKTVNPFAKKDTVVPTITVQDITNNPNAFEVGRHDLKLTTRAGTSKIAKVEVKKPDNIWYDITDTYKNTYIASENGTYWFRATNNAGVTSAPVSISFTNINNSGPVATVDVSVEGGTEYVEGTWVNKDVIIRLQNVVTGLQGLTYFVIDEAAVRTDLIADEGGVAAFKAEEGNKEYTLFIENSIGALSEAITIKTMVDKTLPVIEPFVTPTGWVKGEQIIAPVASDDLSGLPTEGAYSFDGGYTWVNENGITIELSQVIEYRVRDNAGNISETRIIMEKLDNEAPALIEYETDQNTVSLKKDVVITSADLLQKGVVGGVGIDKMYLTNDYPYEQGNFVGVNSEENDFELEKKTSSSRAVTPEEKWVAKDVECYLDGTNEMWLVAVDKLQNVNVYSITMENMIGTNPIDDETTPPTGGGETIYVDGKTTVVANEKHKEVVVENSVENNTDKITESNKTTGNKDEATNVGEDTSKTARNMMEMIPWWIWVALGILAVTTVVMIVKRKGQETNEDDNKEN